MYALDCMRWLREMAVEVLQTPFELLVRPLYAACPATSVFGVACGLTYRAIHGLDAHTRTLVRIFICRPNLLLLRPELPGVGQIRFLADAGTDERT